MKRQPEKNMGPSDDSPERSASAADRAGEDVSADHASDDIPAIRRSLLELSYGGEFAAWMERENPSLPFAAAREYDEAIALVTRLVGKPPHRSSEKSALTSKDALILRLRTRLAIVEPVYRAAIAAHRSTAASSPGQHERIERLERQVDRALDEEHLVAQGHAIDLDEDLP
jgi:hypothetical protein